VADSNLFKDEITVHHDGKSYTFRIPSPRDMARAGILARNLRMEDDPDSGGSADGLDPLTDNLYFAMAYFKACYLRGDNNWVHTPNEDGVPVIEPKAWEPDAPVLTVFELFTDELTRFREGRHTN